MSNCRSSADTESAMACCVGILFSLPTSGCVTGMRNDNQSTACNVIRHIDYAVIGASRASRAWPLSQKYEMLARDSETTEATDAIFI